MLIAGPRSPLARAVLPVGGGILVLAAILGLTWGVAAWISRGGAESTARLAPETFRVGGVESVATEIDESGPMLFPGLATTAGERTLVLHHTGDNPTRNWQVFWAYPDGGDPACVVTQIPESDRFTDCDGAELAVAELTPAEGACPIVDDRTTLLIGLRPEVCTG